MEIKSHKQAVSDGDKYYFTGKACPHGHISLRRVSKKDCMECRKSYMQNCRSNGKKSEWDKAYITKNPEKRKQKRYLQKKVRSKRILHTEWDSFAMSECLSLCATRKKETGFDWHTDHLIPLKAKEVCGLHIGDNLQVIPAQMNLKKGNKLWYTKRYQFVK